MLQSVTECYRILQSITECYRVVQSSTEYYRVLQSSTEYYRVLQNVTDCYRLKQSIAEYYRVFLAHLLGPIFGLIYQMVMEKHGDMDLFEFIDRNPVMDEPLSCLIFR